MIETLSTLVGKEINNPRVVIEQGFRGISTDTANCLMRVNTAYSVCDGTILSVDKSPKTDEWCVTVEVGPSRWVRYCGLSSTGLLAGKEIHKRDFVGYGNNGYIRFEYCTANKNKFPVRILGIQLYKQDPTPIIFTKKDITEM